MNCWTRARKFLALALRRVVGVFLDALDLLLIGLDAAAAVVELVAAVGEAISETTPLLGTKG